uniref:J domain-containing protein n=1 Tax=viral metagenome TaxID=1070528 RepID=A0A6C0J7T9_9ZZZZ
MTDTINPYTILGLSQNCTEAQIKQAYKKKAIKYHPDRNKAPEATVKFQEIKEAHDMLMDLQDPQLNMAYQRGGWDFVKAIKQQNDARSQKIKTCPQYSIKLPVTLRQLILRKKVNIIHDIPTLNEKGVKNGTKKFELELKLDPNAMGKQQIVQHAGIDRPDYMSGDIIIEYAIDWSKEATKFEINNNDLIYKHKIEVKDLFSECNIKFKHPNGNMYHLIDFYDHPEDNGTQIYIIPKAGLTANDNLLIVLEFDYTTLGYIRKNSSIRKHLIEELSNVKSSTIDKGAINVKSIAITPEQHKAQIMKQRRRMGGISDFVHGGNMMNGGNVTECNTQ